MQQPHQKYASDHARMLWEALREKGIDAELEYSDGHKTVDIAILNSRMYIEVDGLQHFTNPDQIMRDFKRSHFSDGDDFNTFYVTNQILDLYLGDVVNALIKVIETKSK